MTLTSAKKRWATKLALALFFIPAGTAQAARRAPFPKYSYTGKFEGELAGHLRNPRNLASQKFTLDFLEKASFTSSFKGALGFSAWNEAAYAAIPSRYPDSVTQNDSRDIRVRDAFLQYQADHFFIRAGNQQVVWGEAFGFFYSDIVNPKDLRYGLFGDLSDTRLQTPMLNAKLIFSDFSLQAIAIPKPYFNLLPSPGNDFAYPYQQLFPVQSFQIRRETSLALEQGNQEYGGRADVIIGGFDISAFGFYYFDRNPYYVVDAETALPQTLIVDERHARVQSYGLTMTKDFDGYVFRFEGLTTRNRLLPAIQNSTLTTAKVNNYIYVAGLDLPTWQKLNLGFQWSQDLLDQSPPGLLRDRIQSLATLRLQRPMFRDHNAELLYSYSLNDAGQRAQFNYMIPLSGRLETSFGLDVLGGPPSSEFGRTNQATRGYVLLKYFLKG